MAVELAVAYVSIVPSTEGMKGQLTKQMDGPVEAAGKRSGSRFGSALTGVAGKALKTGGVAIAATFATSLAKGFGRLKAIDDARFKLQGLGHDAGAVETIMDSALKSVKGTAFGLGDAATIAASAVAAGVKPGEDLTRTLSLTGDAASIAGVSLSEMGAIFGKVGASNRMMTEEMNQLQDRGLPVLSWLQEELGATAEEVREMVSSGEVDFATFQKIIEDNIGGAALKAGESFGGAFANMGAALGRFGATLLGPAFERGPVLFGRITSGIDKLSGVAGPLAERFGQQLPKVFGRLSGALQSTATDQYGLAEAFQAGTEWQGEVFEDMTMIEGVMSRLGGVYAAVTQGQYGLVEAFRTGTEWNGEVFEDMNGIEAVMSRLGGVFAAFGDHAVKVFGTFKFWVADNQATISAWRSKIDEIIGKVAPTFKAAFDAVHAIVSTVVSIVTELWDRFGIHLVSFGARTFGRIINIVSEAFDIVKSVFDIFAGVFTGDWSRVWSGVKEIFSSVWGIVQNLVSGGWDLIKTVFGAGVAVVSKFWGDLWDAIKIMASGAIDRVVGLFTGLRDSAVAKVDDLVTRVRQIKDDVLGFFAGAGRWLVDAGKNIISGLISGIGSMARALSDKVSSVITSITDKLPWSPAKEGPLRKHPPSVGGANIVRQIAAGMGSQVGTLSRMADVAARAAMPGTVSGPRAPAPVRVGAYAPAGGGEIDQIRMQRELRGIREAMERQARTPLVTALRSSELTTGG